MVPNPWMGILFFCLFCTSSFVCFDVEVLDTNLGRKTYRLKFFCLLEWFSMQEALTSLFLFQPLLIPWHMVVVHGQAHQTKLV